ncbi:MAG: hypothetical protein NC086_01660 [Alistipes sp.]|nr:hypothetical protein [Alistipes sp.]
MKKWIFRLLDMVIVFFSLMILLFSAERVIWTIGGNKSYTEEKDGEKNRVFRTAEFTEITEFPIRYGDESMRFCIGRLTNGKRVVVMYTEDTENGLNINTGIKGLFIRDKGTNEFFRSQIDEPELADYCFYVNENPYRINGLSYVLCGLSVMGLLYVIFKKFFYHRHKRRE